MSQAATMRNPPSGGSGFSIFQQVFRARPGEPARYPIWSKSTAYAGIQTRRFVPPYRVGGRVFFDDAELATQDRLIRLAAALNDADLPQPLADEVQDFHFSKEGVAAIAKALPAGKWATEAAALSTECFWLHDTIAAAREARQLKPVT